MAAPKQFKLTLEDIATIRRRFANGAKPVRLAKEYKVTRGHIHNILVGNKWA